MLEDVRSEIAADVRNAKRWTCLHSSYMEHGYVVLAVNNATRLVGVAGDPSTCDQFVRILGAIERRFMRLEYRKERALYA